MFTPQQQAVLASLSRGASRTTACHAAHLPRRTFYNWIKADPLFSDAVDDAEAESVGIAEDLAYECTMNAREDPRYQRSLFFWLKHRAGWVQARPDRAPAPPPGHCAWPQHAAPTPDTDPDLSSSGDGTAPAENPVIGVPSVPSETAPGDARLTSSGRGTLLACPPLEPTPTQTEAKYGISVPIVPLPSAPPENTESGTRTNPASSNPKSFLSSRRQDQLRFQQFRRTLRK